MDAATIRFRLALPFAVFPASPPLAALHAHRTRTIRPFSASSDFPACARCGSLLAQHQSSFRNKNNNTFLRRSCPICGAVTDRMLPTAAFPPTRSHGKLPQKPPPDVSSPPSPITSAATQKSRPKKKSGLQHLLARNREIEEKERQKQKHNSTQIGGLAAFLSDLS